MKPREWALVVAAVAVAIIGSSIGSCQYRRAMKWEAAARVALDRAHNAQILVDQAEDHARVLEQRAAKRDTVIKTVVLRVAAADSLHPPDSSCAPNIAVRDTLIQQQAAQISDLHNQTVVQAGAIRLLQSSNNELRSVLASRPKAYPFLIGPNVSIGAFVGWCGMGPCGGVGVTINIGGIRL